MAAKRKPRKSARASRTGAEVQMVEMLHRIWLAGLGAVSKAQHGAPQLLEDLIEEGARLDTQARGAARKAVTDVLGTMQKGVRSRIGQVRGRTSEALDNLERMFQVRVHRALSQLGVPSSEEIEALSKRVDALNTSIDKLARARNHAPKPRSRASAARKTQPAMPPAP
jgi:poly(hydroxyalkanoate) granule-associated protein